MCQLLGLSFNKEIQPANYLFALILNSHLHQDGWGVAYYPDGCASATVFKEPVPGYASLLAPFLYNYPLFKTNLLVAHIRKATRGNVIFDNTHPFTRSCRGRNFAFVHNGTLPKRKKLTRLSFEPTGDTDSERAFCYLLTQLKSRLIRPVSNGTPEEYSSIDFQVIHEILADINLKTAGAFNVIFSDGKYLFCYRDLAKARDLFYLKGRNNLKNKRTTKIFTHENLHIGGGANTKGFIAATEPLTNGIWIPFKGGQLIVVKNGKVVADIQAA